MFAALKASNVVGLPYLPGRVPTNSCGYPTNLSDRFFDTTTSEESCHSLSRDLVDITL